MTGAASRTKARPLPALQRRVRRPRAGSAARSTNGIAFAAPCSSPLASARGEELRHRRDENNAEEDLGGRGRITDVPALKSDLIDEEDDRQRRIVGAAQRHDLRLAEQLELQNDLDDDHDERG